MRVIVSAGGTGGHIYPALAIINKIKEKEPNSEILYIGTHNRMEKDIVPAYDISYVSLTITGFKRSLSWENVKTVRYFLKAIKKAKKIIRDFKPDVVIGVGGYVTAPVVYAAHKLHIKTFIHEQNSVPGLSNKFLSRYATKIGVSFENTLSYFDSKKALYTGNPCSEEAILKPKMKKAEYHLQSDKKLVLIVMGSLGSLKVNEKIVSLLPKFHKKPYEVLYVTGKEYYDEIKTCDHPSNVIIVPYVHDLVKLMKVTDIMVSRAGASTMSEIVAIEVPTILVPSPYVTNNHQMKNAMDLVSQKAAVLLEENHLENLISCIDQTFEPKTYLELKKNLKGKGVRNSATKIYEILKEMVEDGKRS